MLSENPSPQTTLVILLGASHWPYHSQLTVSHAFSASASKVRNYFCNPRLFGLPSKNWLDLFDQHQNNPDEVDQRIGTFLTQRIDALKQVGTPAKDLLFYYIGHGVLTLDEVQAYHLAILSTRKANIGASSVAMASLAHTLKTQARHLRRTVILDCCFAAKAFPYLAQSAIEQMIQQQTQAVFEENFKGSGFPLKGTALLCSSGQQDLSFLLPDQSGTMFSEALIYALFQGNPRQPDKTHLSLSEVNFLTEDALETLIQGESPKTFIASPDQRDGRVDLVPFFPNAAFRAGQAHLAKEERFHNIQEERRHRDEEEQRSKVKKAEQIPGTKEDRRYQAEEETTRQTIPKATERSMLSSQTSIPSTPQSQTVSTLQPISFSKRSFSNPLYLASIIGFIFIVVVGGTRLLDITISNHVIEVNATATADAHRLSINFYADATANAQTYAANTANGSMFGFDSEQTHYNPYEKFLSSANVSRLALSWTAFSKDTKGWFTPTVADKTVYVSSISDTYPMNLYALDAQTGKTLWTSDVALGTAAVANRIIYSFCVIPHTYSSGACALDAQTKKVLWNSNISGGNPIIANGIVYLGCDTVADNPLMCALDARSGKTLWTLPPDNSSACCEFVEADTPTVANGVAYIASNFARVYARDAKTGNKIWTTVVGGGHIQDALSIANGIIYIGSDDHNLYALDAHTGAQLWVVHTGNRILASPAVANGVVYVESLDHKLYALDAKTGTLRWTSPTDNDISAPPLVANGIIYVGSHDHKLYALDAKTGKTLWFYTTGGIIDEPPVVANGMVYVSSEDGRLYAFHLPDPIS